MDDSGNIAANLARAVSTAMDWSSSPDARKAAVSYLESIKTGDVHILASTCFLLIKRDWSSEIRLHGFKMLQYLVRLRWDEFSLTERRNFANTAMNFVTEMVDPREEWAMKSQTAALVAEVIRREGLNLWQDFLPSLISMASIGPIEGEMVAMMLRWIPEDITVHNEDLEGDRRRALLRGLTQSLREILPLLYNLLEKHFGAALDEAGKQQFDTAKKHAATVTATLNAINAYAEWAPVPDLAKYGLIQGCGFLLSSLEFRLHACEFFKLLSQRKRFTDDSTADFDSAMGSIYHILIYASRDFLHRSSSNPAGMDENEFEFAECICESMMFLGSASIQCIGKDGTMLGLYLQQLLGYFQHFKLAIHFQSLLFWLALMRDMTFKEKNLLQTSKDSSSGTQNGSGSGQADNENIFLSGLMSDDICAAILDVSFQRMLKKAVSTEITIPTGTLELWTEDFDGKSDFSQYRSRLLELIKLVASLKPVVAVTKASERINTIIKRYSNVTTSAEALALLESMELGLEAVIAAAYDGSDKPIHNTTEFEFGPHKILEGLLQQILSLKWTEPAFAMILGRYLNAFGPFLRCFPESARGVINKLFELLTSLPVVLTDSSPTSARHARLQICTSFVRIAKAADTSLLPHMREIADTMAYLEAEGRLLRGERNLLAEAFLVMASSAGIQQQEEVLAWLLEPSSRQWMQLEWQNAFLSEPLGLVHLCSDTQFMWSLFHTITLFEKALKRSGGVRKSNLIPNSSSTVESYKTPNPMSSHLSWMLPPLLKLLRCLHSLWSQPVAQALPPELKAAMSMSHVERASLLGEGVSKQTKGQQIPTDGSQIDINTDGCVALNENDLRNWLKGIRDSGYNVLGMSASIGESFFRCMDSSSVALALVENVQSMEFRHIRQLVHQTVVPLIKFCPPESWDDWIEKLLHPILHHCQHVISCSWASLLREGRAKVPDIFGNLSGQDLKVEVMEEKLLRALTREICQLLCVLGSPSLNVGLPSIEHLGNVQRVGVSSLRDLDAFASSSLACFILTRKHLSLPTLQMSIEAFSWTDSEAVTKVASFCGVVTHLAISTNNTELNTFVAKDLFCAIIQSLTLESNAVISSILVGLCHEIFFHLLDRDPTPRQILLSLPGIKSNELLAFEDALAKTSSPKEQKQHMKSLLLLASENKFKALAVPRMTNVITNVSTKLRSSASNPGDVLEGDEVIGLAAIT